MPAWPNHGAKIAVYFIFGYLCPMFFYAIYACVELNERFAIVYLLVTSSNSTSKRNA